SWPTCTTWARWARTCRPRWPVRRPASRTSRSPTSRTAAPLGQASWIMRRCSASSRRRGTPAGSAASTSRRTRRTARRASAGGSPMAYDLVVRSRRAVLPDGTRPAAVAVSGAVIAAIEDHGARLEADREVDLGDLALLPGRVDTHVHVNEPGRTEGEGFAPATRAAA